MANWLTKIFPPAPSGQRRNLPTAMRPGPLMAPRRPGTPPGTLPNATVIYAIAAAALFTIALDLMLFHHKWVTGLLVMLPAACFLGFALHFLKYPQS